MEILSLISPLFSICGGKVKLWVDGHKGLIEKSEELFKNKKENRIWFHCASLGEFEQGRQLIEDIRGQYSDSKIVVTFFSPSGYEPRKSYAGADYVLYLPLDTPCAARRFVAAMNPKIVIFVKYEFWHNLLKESDKIGAKIYVVSAIFNPKQYFFKWWGGFGRKTLSYFDHLFVQNEESMALLKGIGVTNVSITGDTRFDRVYSLAKSAKQIDQMEQFSQTDRPILVAGSTWEPDDALLIEMVGQFADVKFVIVPHELPRPKITSIKERCEAFGRKVVYYTDDCSAEERMEADVMIIDTIGILSSTYRYAKIAYIGGGFGVGIHNTLEAATYGLPIAFGPNYSRFAEAIDLIGLGAAQSISNRDQLQQWITKLLEDHSYREKCSAASRDYVASKIGATQMILKQMKG